MIVERTDFVSVPTQDLETAVRFYGETLGLHRSVYMPERNFAEFETGNLTLNILDPVKMGIGEFTPSGSPITPMAFSTSRSASSALRPAPLWSEAFSSGLSPHSSAMRTTRSPSGSL
jgi:catechol 2,3-dioxygenase-like lactoylglutathione lyase family enzyme